MLQKNDIISPVSSRRLEGASTFKINLPPLLIQPVLFNSIRDHCPNTLWTNRLGRAQPSKRIYRKMDKVGACHSLTIKKTYVVKP